MDVACLRASLGVAATPAALFRLQEENLTAEEAARKAEEALLEAARVDAKQEDTGAFAKVEKRVRQGGGGGSAGTGEERGAVGVGGTGRRSAQGRVAVAHCCKPHVVPPPPLSSLAVRNLRIREDTAKYLLNLDLDSAYYDPKSRSMREDPTPHLSAKEKARVGMNEHGMALRVMARSCGMAWARWLCTCGSQSRGHPLTHVHVSRPLMSPAPLSPRCLPGRTSRRPPGSSASGSSSRSRRRRRGPWAWTCTPTPPPPRRSCCGVSSWRSARHWRRTRSRGCWRSTVRNKSGVRGPVWGVDRCAPFSAVAGSPSMVMVECLRPCHPHSHSLRHPSASASSSITRIPTHPQATWRKRSLRSCGRCSRRRHTWSTTGRGGSNWGRREMG